jgi:hypothetical protein
MRKSYGKRIFPINEGLKRNESNAPDRIIIRVQKKKD